MATIKEYLEWRGDVPFQLAPINEVDEYIICKIGSLDWTGIVPADGSFVPLHQAVEQYFREGGPETLGVIASPHSVPIVRALPDTMRFGQLELGGFRKKIREETTEQFSALTVRLPGGGIRVTFRGTDDTIVAWQEDCLLAVREQIPAHEDASRYLAWALRTFPGRVSVSGHSKGGNLAVYSSAAIPEVLQSRIEQIWNFDAPGFLQSFLQSEGYLRIRDRIITVVPEHAMVGALLYSDVAPRIAKSSVHGLPAHDGATWETTPTGFVHCEDFSTTSKAFAQSMQKALADMSVEERERFVEEFFGALKSNGADTLTEISAQSLRRALSMGISLGRGAEVQKMASELASNMTHSLLSAGKRKLTAHRRVVKPSAEAEPEAIPEKSPFREFGEE